MSLGGGQTYVAPFVEDVFSEAGDRPLKPSHNSRRPRQPPPTASGPSTKAGTNRSASDSGYSSRTDQTAKSSATGSGSYPNISQDVEQRDRQRTPYQNNHQPRKESLGSGKKLKPKPISSSRSEPGSSKSKASLQQHHLEPNAHATSERYHPMAAPLRINTGVPTSAMPPPPLPPQYHRPPTPSYTPSFTPQYSGHYPIHAGSAPSYTGQGSQTPSYFPTQPVSAGYVPSHASFANPPTSHPVSYYPAQPPAPSPTFAVPNIPQRPHPVMRHTAPVVNQMPGQNYGQFTTIAEVPGQQRYPSQSPRKQQRSPDDVPFLDTDGQIKCYINGQLCSKKEERPAERPRLKAKAHHRHTREATPDSSSEDSSCSCSSESEYEERRPSPRRNLHRAQTPTESRPSSHKPSRRGSYASSRHSDTRQLAEEMQKLSAVEEYQAQVSTPPRRTTGAPRYIEDTARATKATSPRQDSGTTSPQSPARSRTSDACTDSRRESLIISTKGPFSFRPTEDGYSFDTAEGQEIKMTISNGQGQRKEKRYHGDGSRSGRYTSRRESMASSHRGRESSDMRRAAGRHDDGN